MWRPTVWGVGRRIDMGFLMSVVNFGEFGVMEEFLCVVHEFFGRENRWILGWFWVRFVNLGI